MTEADWLTPADSSEPSPAVIDYLRCRVDARQSRLLGCAAARRYWRLMGDGRSREAVEVSELYADGLVGPDQLATATRAAVAAEEGARLAMESANAAWLAVWKARLARDTAGATVPAQRRPAAAEEESIAAEDAWQAAQRATWAAEGFTFEPLDSNGELSPLLDDISTGLLREVIGNLFRRAAVDPAWVGRPGDTVLAMARAIYERADFHLMPALADALQGAGCRHTDALEHCRLKDGHVRGCWVLDHLLRRAR